MDSTPRRVVVSEFLSLDGVMEDPSWTAPYWNDEIAAFKDEETAAAEALLLGRVTYEMFSAVWPTSEDDGAPVINALPKHVASTSLTQADLDRTGWNATLLGGEAVDAVRALKQAPGGDLLVWGSAAFTQALMAADLVDEYRLIVYPVVLGSGKRLFGPAETTLRLIETRPFQSGATGLVYRPVSGPSGPRR